MGPARRLTHSVQCQFEPDKLGWGQDGGSPKVFSASSSQKSLGGASTARKSEQAQQHWPAECPPLSVPTVRRHGTARGAQEEPLQLIAAQTPFLRPMPRVRKHGRSGPGVAWLRVLSKATLLSSHALRASMEGAAQELVACEAAGRNAVWHYDVWSSDACW